MNISEQLTLESQKIDKKARLNPEYASYFSRFLESIEEYDIMDTAFENDKSLVINTAIRFLNMYEINSKFLEDSERCVLTLALADSWISTKDITEKKNLLNVLKILSYGINEENQHDTLSKKVQKLSIKGFPRGYNFDPGGGYRSTEDNLIPESEVSVIFGKIIVYLFENVNEDLSERYSEYFKNWDQGSPMSKVRKKLNITPDKEIPVIVRVINASTDELSLRTGGSALHLESDGVRYLMFSMDRPQLNYLEHEYAHSQSVGFHSYMFGTLFMGLNEAITESLVNMPYSYSHERWCVYHLMHIAPELKNIYIEAYKGDKQKRKEFFKIVINKTSLKTFLNLARMYPRVKAWKNNTLSSVTIEPIALHKELFELRKAIEANKPKGFTVFLQKIKSLLIGKKTDDLEQFTSFF